MTLIIAHRGASRVETENTLAAFERAVAMGADGVELDVRRTADDRLVVHHDPRLADGRVIRGARSGEIPEHVPQLEAALDACDGIFVNIEIKNDPTEPDFDPTEWVAHRVGAEVARRGGGPRWLISSFRLETIAACRVTMPSSRTAFLVEHADADVIAATASGGHAALHPWATPLDEATVRAAHRAGLAVNVWTCDEPARIAEMIAWGVDGICTNVPDIALAIRRHIAG